MKLIPIPKDYTWPVGGKIYGFRHKENDPHYAIILKVDENAVTYRYNTWEYHRTDRTIAKSVFLLEGGRIAIPSTFKAFHTERMGK